MTWFRNQHDFPELNMSHFPDPEQALKEALRLMEFKELDGSPP
jgi:hypothetical protein